MLPLVFEAPIAEWLFGAMLAAFLVTENVIRLRSHRNQSGAKREWTSFFVIVVGLFGGIVGAVLVADHLTATGIPFGRVAFLVAGLALMALGFKQIEAHDSISGAQAMLGAEAAVEDLVRASLKKGN